MVLVGPGILLVRWSVLPPTGPGVLRRSVTVYDSASRIHWLLPEVECGSWDSPASIGPPGVERGYPEFSLASIGSRSGMWILGKRGHVIFVCKMVDGILLICIIEATTPHPSELPLARLASKLP
jgi:hypothetical protein